MREAAAAYPALLRAGVLTALTYRGRLVLLLVGGVFPLLVMGVWLTVAAQAGPPAGWTGADFVSYYAAAVLLWNLSGQDVVWRWDADLRSGELSARLLRPVHPFHQYAAADLGHRVVLLALLTPLLAAGVLLVPGLRLDPRPAAWPVAAAAVLLAYVLSLLMAATFALVGFWSTQTSNVWMLWWGLGSFASGWVAPLALMPPWLGTVARLLPFRATLGFPAELLTGRLDAAETAAGFAAALAWTGVFAGAYVLLWRRGVRRYQAVAG